MVPVEFRWIGTLGLTSTAVYVGYLYYALRMRRWNPEDVIAEDQWKLMCVLIVILPLELCSLTVVAHGATTLALIVSLVGLGMSCSLAWSLYNHRGVSGVLLVLSGVTIALLLAVTTQYGKSQVDLFAELTIAVRNLTHGMSPYLHDSPLLVVNPNLTSYVKIAYLAYGPGAVLLSVPGYLLGDIRISDLVGMVVLWASVAMLYRRVEGPQWWGGRALLALAVLSPLTLLMLQLAWVDTLSMMCFVLWLLLRTNRSLTFQVLAAIALGIFLEMKITNCIMVYGLFLLSRQMRRDIACGVAAAVVIALPFAVWSGPITFLRALVGGPAGWGIRTDGWSIPALVYSLFHVLLPPNLTLAAAALPFAYLTVVRPRTGSEAALGTVFVVLAFFVLGKLAFPNYYFDVVILCIVGPCIAAEPILGEGMHELLAESPVSL